MLSKIIVDQVSDAQLNEAGDHTKRAVNKIRSLLKELDLSMASFDSVAGIFAGQLHTVMMRDGIKADQERHKKIAAIEKKVFGEHGTHPDDYFPMPRMGRPMVQRMSPQLFDMSDEELDAEYRRVVVDGQKP